MLLTSMQTANYNAQECTLHIKYKQKSGWRSYATHRDKNTINSQQHVNKASAQLNTAHRNRIAALPIDH